MNWGWVAIVLGILAVLVVLGIAGKDNPCHPDNAGTPTWVAVCT